MTTVVFIRGSEVIGPDNWRGTVLQQCPRSVVCLALGFEPNDDLAGYRVWDPATLALVPSGDWLDTREPTFIAWRCRDAAPWQPKRSPCTPGARSRPPTQGAADRLPTAPARPRANA